MRLSRSFVALVVCACMVGVAAPVPDRALAASERSIGQGSGDVALVDVQTSVLPTGETAIKGRLTDSKTGAGIQGAIVTGYNTPPDARVPGSQYVVDATTNNLGDFYIRTGRTYPDTPISQTVPLLACPHRLTAKATNYRTLTKDITVVGGKDNRLNFPMVYHVPTGYLDFDIRDVATGGVPRWTYMMVTDGSMYDCSEQIGTSGDLTFGVTPGKRYYAWVWSLDYGSRWFPAAPGDASPYLSAADGTTIKNTIKLSKTARGTVSAAVTDATTGEPIEGISVVPSIGDPFGRAIYSPPPFVTNAGGVASAVVPVGLYRFEYRDPTGAHGYKVHLEKTASLWGTRVDVPSSPSVSLSSQLTTGYAIAGTLRDSSGDPVVFGHGYAPSTVEVWRYKDTYNSCAVASVAVGSDGAYAVSGLSAGEYFVVGKAHDEVAGSDIERWVGSTIGEWNDATRFVVGGTPTLTVDVPFTFDQTTRVPGARYGGANRYDTAAVIAVHSFSTARTAILATGEKFPDALAASSLAGALEAPLLLTKSTAIDWSTINALKRLGVSRVIIVGSTASVSAGVVSFLSYALPSVSVERIGGVDRYQTSRLVAERVVAETGVPSGAFLVRGDAFADALAVSPLAYASKRPVVLTPPGYLGTDARRTITTLGITDVTIAGGPTAVAAGVKNAVAALPGMTVRRVSGANRYSTTVAVAQWGIDNGLVTSDYVGLATGLNFPDALGGGIACGQRGGLLLLTQPTALSAETRTMLTGSCSRTTALRVFGSTSGVSKAACDAAVAALAGAQGVVALQ